MSNLLLIMLTKNIIILMVSRMPESRIQVSYHYSAILYYFTIKKIQNPANHGSDGVR